MQIPMPHMSFDPDEPHDGVGICADVPLGSEPLDYYKKIAVSVLAQQIVQLIEPEFIEGDGFEVMRYPIIVIRNGEDGRNTLNVHK